MVVLSKLLSFDSVKVLCLSCHRICRAKLNTAEPRRPCCRDPSHKPLLRQAFEYPFCAGCQNETKNPFYRATLPPDAQVHDLTGSPSHQPTPPPYAKLNSYPGTGPDSLRSSRQSKPLVHRTARAASSATRPAKSDNGDTKGIS
jgi:hypothetical protein